MGLFDMGVIADVILAVAVIAAAAGAVTELKLRIGYIRSAAYGAFVKIVDFWRRFFDLMGNCRGKLNDSSLSTGRGGFLAEYFFRFDSPGEGDNIQNVLSEEQEVIRNGDKRKQINREGTDKHIEKCQHQVKQSKNPRFYRDDEEQQEGGVGIEGSICQEKTHVEISYICPDVIRIGEHHAEDIHQDYACEIEKIESQRAPLLLDYSAK